MKTSPLAGLLALSLLGCMTALLAGLGVLAILLAAASMACAARQRSQQKAASVWQPRPTITYLPGPRMDDPLIRLERGQTATVPWPHPLQILLPHGSRLQILEATPDRVRVMAV